MAVGDTIAPPPIMGGQQALAQAVRTFQPSHAAQGDFAPLTLRAPVEFGKGQAAKLAQQKALSEQIRGARTATGKTDYGALGPVGAPANLTKEELAELANTETTTSLDPYTGSWLEGAIGLDKGVGWSQEDYDEWNRVRSGQQSYQYGPEYLSFQDKLMGITPNERDPYNFGPDYATFYEGAHGKGSYDSEINRYLALAKEHPEESYWSMYGKLPTTDPIAMENWMRRANTGGSWTAGQQDRIASNADTELTEGLLMAALSMGMGALTGPVLAGGIMGTAGPTYGGLAGSVASGLNNMPDYAG
jgi:hypothetical protein